jgi:hypothetical protein
MHACSSCLTSTCTPEINLQELLAIQQSDGPKNLGFFGTRNMGMTHQKLVEILSYAMVSTVRRRQQQQQQQQQQQALAGVVSSVSNWAALVTADKASVLSSSTGTGTSSVLQRIQLLACEALASCCCVVVAAVGVPVCARRATTSTPLVQLAPTQQ